MVLLWERNGRVGIEVLLLVGVVVVGIGVVLILLRCRGNLSHLLFERGLELVRLAVVVVCNREREIVLEKEEKEK